MSDEWQEPEPQPRRRGIPKGVWIACGCGCLVVVLALVALSVGGFVLYQRGTDPERVWPRVDEVLHFDERPADLAIEFGMPFASLLPIDQIHLLDEETGVRAIVYASEDAAYTELLMSQESREVPFGMGEPVGAETGSMELQGREVAVLRFDSIRQPFGDQLGAGLRIDLGRTGAKNVVVELRRPGEPLGDEDVQAFFEPFDPWRER